MTPFVKDLVIGLVSFFMGAGIYWWILRRRDPNICYCGHGRHLHSDVGCHRRDMYGTECACLRFTERYRGG